MGRLRIKTGREKGRIIPVKEGETITIGRDENSVICILDSAVSRHHAEVFSIGQMCFIKDLNSKNGTYVNGERIEEELLQEGDKIQIGTTLIVYEADVEGVEEDVDAKLSSYDYTGPTTEFDLDKLGISSETDEKEKLPIIYQIGKIISSEKEEHVMIQKITRYLADALNSDGVFFLEFEPEQNKLKLISKLEKNGATINKVSKTIIMRVVKYSKAIMTSNASMDQRFSKVDSVIINDIHSVICVPLICQGKVNGVLYLVRINPEDHFDDDDLELVTEIGIHMGNAIENFRVIAHNHRLLTEIIETLSTLMEIKYTELMGHARRVTKYAVALAKCMKLSQARIRNIQIGALLHDIGGVMHSQEEYTRDIYLNSAHVLTGENIIKKIKDFEKTVLPIIKYHHERYDGSGFPYKLKEEEIPLEAQIVGIADFFDIITSYGMGDKIFSSEEALKYIEENRGKLFSEEMVENFKRCYESGTLFFSS